MGHACGLATLTARRDRIVTTSLSSSRYMTDGKLNGKLTIPPIMIRQAIKQLSRSVGFDVLSIKNVPDLTLLGLASRPVRAVIDVGANDGGFCRFITRFFPDAELHCFEPLEQPFAALQQWLHGRRQARSQAYRLALADHAGVATFVEHVGHSASSSFLEATAQSKEEFPVIRDSQPRTVEVPMSTLDAWAQDTGFVADERTLLKLDVQGFELPVLRGAERTLAGIGICITEVCIAHLYVGQSRFADIVALLDRAGLRYIGNLNQHHAEDGSPLFLDAVFVRS
jgi:FkbM family methyltransferase